MGDDVIGEVVRDALVISEVVSSAEVMGAVVNGLVVSGLVVIGEVVSAPVVEGAVQGYTFEGLKYSSTSSKITALIPAAFTIWMRTLRSSIVVWFTTPSSVVWVVVS